MTSWPRFVSTASLIQTVLSATSSARRGQHTIAHPADRDRLDWLSVSIRNPASSIIIKPVVHRHSDCPSNGYMSCIGFQPQTESSTSCACLCTRCSSATLQTVTCKLVTPVSDVPPRSSLRSSINGDLVVGRDARSTTGDVAHRHRVEWYQTHAFERFFQHKTEELPLRFCLHLRTLSYRIALSLVYGRTTRCVLCSIRRIVAVSDSDVGDQYMLITFLVDFQYVVYVPLFPTSDWYRVHERFPLSTSSSLPSSSIIPVNILSSPLVSGTDCHLTLRRPRHCLHSRDASRLNCLHGAILIAPAASDFPFRLLVDAVSHVFSVFRVCKVP